MRFLAFLWALLPIAAVALACGGGGGRESTSTRTATPGDAGTQGTTNVWLELLGRVPAIDEGREFIAMNNYARLRDLLGVPAPELDSSESELQEYLEDIAVTNAADGRNIPRGTYPGPLLYLDRFPTEFEKRRETLGFNLANVDQEVWLFTRNQVHVLVGRFDGGAIDSALHNDQAYGPSLREETHAGINYYSWPEGDPLDSLNLGLDPPFLWSHALAFDGNAVYWSEAPLMPSMIDTFRDVQPSLADVERYRLLAEGLNRFDRYATVIADSRVPLSLAAAISAGVGTSEAIVEGIKSSLKEKPLLLPYEAQATGVGQDEKGIYMVVVAVHGDAATASENVERLRARVGSGAINYAGQSWQSIISDLEVSSEGPLLLAKFYTEETRLARELLLKLEPFLLYDDTVAQ